MPGVGAAVDIAGDAGEHIGGGIILLRAGGRYGGGLRQIGLVRVGKAGNIAVVADQGLLQFSDIDCADIAALLDGLRGRRADSLAANGAGAHYAAGGHGQLGGAQRAAADIQVFEALGQVGAVGDGVRTVKFVYKRRNLIKGVQAAGNVVIHMPAAVGHCVVKDAVAQHVVFVEHVVALQTAAFAHAGQHAYPYQLVVFRAVVAAVLDVIPHAVYRAHQLIADVLVLADDIGAFAADFDPPVAVILAIAVKEHPDFVFAGLGQHFLGHIRAVLAIAQLLLGKVHGVHGRDELDGMAHIGGLEQQGVAHAILVGLLGSVRLVKLRLALAACAALYAYKSA